MGLLNLIADRNPGRMGKKTNCISLCAELHEGVQALRNFQIKVEQVVNGLSKVSVITLIAATSTELTFVVCKRRIIVLDDCFVVGAVFSILQQASDSRGKHLIHILTRAKSNVVAYHVSNGVKRS